MSFLKNLNDPDYDEQGDWIMYQMLDDDSPQSAINMNCVNCRYTSCSADTWRQQIDKCLEAECIFHNVRPRAKKKRAKIK